MFLTFTGSKLSSAHVGLGLLDKLQRSKNASLANFPERNVYIKCNKAAIIVHQLLLRHTALILCTSLGLDIHVTVN